jgi:hypothetical protein
MAYTIADIAPDRAPNFGEATAVKRGRNPRWPFVPVIRHATGRTEQVRGFAYETRDAARQQAAHFIALRKQSLEERLLQRVQDPAHLGIEACQLRRQAQRTRECALH